MTVRQENYIDERVDATAEEAVFAQIGSLLKALRPEWFLDQVIFKPFTNGITNKVISVQGGKGEKLIFRIFGVGTEKVVDRNSEMKSFELLSRHGLAPAVEARFANGFVCGYLPGEPIDVESVRSAKLVPKIASRMADLHKIPIADNEKASPSFFHTKFHQFINNIPPVWPNPEKNQKFQHLFAEINFERDFQRVAAAIERAANKEIVLCHNDLLIYNVLYDEKSDSVNFIDYEYTGANYQLFDIANHFNEYAGVENINYDLCPTDEQKYNFVQHYLQSYLGREVDGAEIEKVLADIPTFEAASHLLWSVWALVQAQDSEIDFDYIQYASKRYEQYFKIITSVDFSVVI
ncbi:unnamed protein product [Bursaphelenchus xylophilus]|uniref:ethanolamine kinase n=1 Tax=Bursaphelenchus xylophilus TaxID=6326 RepID=A0A1I7SS41_BURXY|nr:unnamed protein product [Bursaphelenchus xylophilus]CAG9105705.1 unnamed protein product [Bursaphelenchus xylophilus]